MNTMAPIRNRCKQCGAKRDTNVPISKRGLCPNCAVKNVQENLRAQVLKSGPAYEKWRDAWNNAPKLP